MARETFPPKGAPHPPLSAPGALAKEDLRKHVAETREIAQDRRARAQHAFARTRQLLQASTDTLHHTQAWSERQVELGHPLPVLASEPRLPLLLIDGSRADATLFRYVLTDYGLRGQLTVLQHRGEVEAFFAQAPTGAFLSQPQLIITDCRIPGMEVKEIMAAVRTVPAYQRVPVILFSTLPEEEGQRLSAACSATMFVHKPGALEAFVEAVSTMVQRWSENSDGADPPSTPEGRR